jgi:hypothetical protein
MIITAASSGDSFLAISASPKRGSRKTKPPTNVNLKGVSVHCVWCMHDGLILPAAAGGVNPGYSPKAAISPVHSGVQVLILLVMSYAMFVQFRLGRNDAPRILLGERGEEHLAGVAIGYVLLDVDLDKVKAGFVFGKVLRVQAYRKPICFTAATAEII